MGYQILVLLVPLVTVPYVARVIGAYGVGVNDYTYAIVLFFLLFGQVGVLTYGNREIAYHRDNKFERSKIFWEIELLQIVTIALSYIAFLIFVYFFGGNSKIYLLLQSLMIIAGIFDISWYFMGMENFKKTVVRNTLVKLVTTVLTFVIVRNGNDIWKYVLLMAGSQLLGNMTFWPYLFKEIKLIKLSRLSIFRHFLPATLLFIPTITTQIYLLVNRIMLGAMDPTGSIAVGIFSQSDKIIKLVLAIVTATGTVMLPHIANKFVHGDMAGKKKSLYNSFDFVTAISVPIMFGIIGIAKQFAPWFLGNEFKSSGIVMIIESPVILLIAWSNVTGKQFLMPVNRVKDYTMSVSLGAIINIICNFVLIKLWGVNGASIATVISELFVTGYQFKCVHREINLKEVLWNTWRYILPAFGMSIVVHYLCLQWGISIFKLCIEILIGMLIYIIGILMTKAPILGQVKDFITSNNN